MLPPLVKEMGSVLCRLFTGSCLSGSVIDRVLIFFKLELQKKMMKILLAAVHLDAKAFLKHASAQINSKSHTISYLGL